MGGVYRIQFFFGFLYFFYIYKAPKCGFHALVVYVTTFGATAAQQFTTHFAWFWEVRAYSTQRPTSRHQCPSSPILLAVEARSVVRLPGSSNTQPDMLLSSHAEEAHPS